jgi:hypothetical protein
VFCSPFPITYIEAQARFAIFRIASKGSKTMAQKKSTAKTALVSQKKIDLKKPVRKSSTTVMPRLAANHNETLLLK